MKLANGNYIQSTERFSWWLRQKRYLRYMMRELSSLFIGGFTLLMISGVYRLSESEAAYTQWLNGLWNNLTILSVIIFIFSVYHSYTWFIVTPKAMPLKFAGKRVASWIIIGAHLLLWFVCSLVIWLLFIN